MNDNACKEVSSHPKTLAVASCGVAFLILTVMFGFVPGTMLNYGYDYWQFLHPLWLAVPMSGILVLWNIHRVEYAKLNRFFNWFSLVFVVILPFACWFLRTKVHCFGGDGAAAWMPTDDFSLFDWVPPMPGKGRLDGFGSAFIAKLCGKCGMFERSTVLPSMLATAVYSAFVGCLFVLSAFLGFRRSKGLFLAIVTSPFVFNFFGNVDSYAFSLLVALVFILAAIHLFKAKSISLCRLAALGILWGIGMWTHPFHVFEGFLLAVLVARWLKRHEKLRQLPEWSLPVAFGMVFFAAVKCSAYGNAWFDWEFAKPPPTFSIDTFTHYFNMILLPALPWIAAAWIGRNETTSFKVALFVFLSESVVFFSMAFTLGAVDQFNYYHLLFFFLSPWVVLFAVRGLQPVAAALIIVCNLCLLIPMVAVHSTDKTIARAEALYPVDPCHHNRVMSWQTHLGLCLGDNLQDSIAVKRACLKAFFDGARNAVPAGFRGGNYVYHTAFLYHYGEFDRGRRQMDILIKENPQIVRWFLGERPAFIYMNRKRLWDDIGEILSQRHPDMASQWRDVTEKLADAVKSHPYYATRPKYAATPY